MKQSFHFSALLLFLLLLSSKISARFIPPKQGQEEVKLKEITSKGSLQQMEDSQEMMNLMGMEVCEDGDEECLKRRVISEAHLDYIYTQHHKP
ncbi:Phytosulfokine [Melia azedarach]|uniref:Phytosulfokine n=1 Tax=Melia azedarach TaxID=155640 RepID=A0ACC1YMF4_MELAZ|nr:Phytosulfokine [Melia azedarach]